MTTTFETVLILLASAVLVVVVFRSLHLPPLLGYLMVGVAIGPHALGWVSSSSGTDYLAEFGVVFLMFTIGLEFSLPRLTHMRRAVFGLGGSQVAVTLLVVMAVAWPVLDNWRAAFALGGALAMSSTAIVLRMLAERMQLDTPHGRDTLGVLLMQDLAVIALLILIPALGGDTGDLVATIGIALLKAALVLTIILFAGQRLMRSWFHVIARRRSQELFVINVLLITLGLAYVTEAAGLSLALGAFLAGMLISETEYRHQVEEDIKPFRDVLLGLFFVTVGMKLDLRVVAEHFEAVAAVIAFTTVAKFGIVLGLARFFGAPTSSAMRSALALAQAGEFGLVLIGLATDSRLLSAITAQVVIAGMLASMLVAPFLILYSDRLVMRFTASEWMLRSLQLHQVAVRSLATEKHVVVCGYGRTGQSLARFLDREGIGYVALDLDPDRVQEAAGAGDTVVFGDASRRETLIAAGLRRAAALVITYADTPSALRVLACVRAVNPGLPVVVRTIDDSDLERLSEAGATEVVPETFESSLMLASHAMLLVGLPLKRVLTRIRDVRNERYRLLRGFYRGTTDDADDIDASPRLHSVTLPAGAYAVGRTLDELELAAIGVEVTAVRRRNIRADEPGPETRLQASDVVVLLGRPQALATAELRLLQGRR